MALRETIQIFVVRQRRHLRLENRKEEIRRTMRHALEKITFMPRLMKFVKKKIFSIRIESPVSRYKQFKLILPFKKTFTGMYTMKFDKQIQYRIVLNIFNMSIVSTSEILSLE